MAFPCRPAETGKRKRTQQNDSVYSFSRNHSIWLQFTQKKRYSSFRQILPALPVTCPTEYHGISIATLIWFFNITFSQNKSQKIMNSVQSSVFSQSRFSLFLCRRTPVLRCKSRNASLARARAACYNDSILSFAACAGCTTAFLSGSSQDVPEKSLQSRRAWRGTKAQNIS